MADPGAYAFVFVAGLVTAQATGLGAVPFFLFEEIGDRWNVLLWGLASGIVVAASLFGLVTEGLAAADGRLLPVGIGLIAGVVLVVLAHDVIVDAHVDPREYQEADFKKLVPVARTAGEFILNGRNLHRPLQRLKQRVQRT
jgi:ZIP family zinc transporter